MAIEFTRMLGGGDAAHPVKDYKIDNAYAATAKPGDLVKLNGAGDVIAALTNDILVLGVFLGMNTKVTADTAFFGKVRTAPNAIYMIDVTGGVPVADGTGYPVTVTAGVPVLNAAIRSTPLVKLVSNKALDNGKYEVVIIGRQLA